MRQIVSFTYEPANGANACRITVTEDGDGFAVTWSDFVANEWLERFGSLSVALVRVATLIRCGESQWQRGFVSDAPAFETSASLFLAGVAQ
jgi:hypothetical protein